MRKTRRLSQIGLVLVLIYSSLCGLLWISQTRLMFFPSAELKATPAAVELAYEEVWLPMPVGKVHGWWIAASNPAAPVLFYLHGNGSNLGDLVGRARRFHDLGLAVFLIDYRGYGRSAGPFPTERRVYEDAEAGWQYLVQTRQIAPDQIHVFGQSIGGAVAIDLGTHHANAGSIIVESTFTSMREMVDYSFPLLPVPVDWLLTQRFDSLSKVRWLQVPILLIHGTADRTVPVAMSQTLFAAAASPKQIWFVPNADHNDVAQIGGAVFWRTIQDFVARFCRCVLPSMPSNHVG